MGRNCWDVYCPWIDCLSPIGCEIWSDVFGDSGGYLATKGLLLTAALPAVSSLTSPRAPGAMWD